MNAVQMTTSEANTDGSAAGEPLIRIRSLSKAYPGRGVQTEALRGLDLDIREGEFVSIEGPSGCGKSTLLSILGLLDSPSAGTYRLAGAPVERIDFNERARVRNRYIGFVFQSFNLVNSMTALDNVMLPLRYSRSIPAAEHLQRAQQALAQVRMADRLQHFPDQLSGGQQQRVAIARALVTGPKLILADEPTGNLDSGTGSEVMELLELLHRQGATIVMVTHDPSLAARATRRLHLFDGQWAR